MADPLSIASGIAGLVALTATILSTGYRVYSQTKQHSENINGLLNEVACFSGVLVGLQSHIGEQQRNSRRARPGEIRFFSTQPCRNAIEECKGILEKIQKLLDKLGKTKSVIRPIRWQFEQDEAKELVNQLERYKSAFILWFQIEHGTRSEQLNSLESTIIAQLDTIRSDQEKAQQQAEIERNLAKRSKVLEWLGSSTAVKHNDTIAVRHEESGLWLLNTPQYSNWISANSSSFFWLNGIPGSGKTVLVSTVINQIQDFYETDAEFGICYYYCDFDRDQSLTTAKLVGSLLAQLLRGETVWEMMEPKILTLFNEHENKSSYPRLQDLEDLLLEVAQVLTRMIIIIDALDEVPNRAGIIEFLLRLIGIEGDIKLFVASRNEPDLEDAFEAFGGLTIRSGDVEADVEQYIRSRISHSRWKNSKESEAVVKTLTQKADGMFLWVHCQLDELCKVRTKIGLESLRGLPRGLESTYRGILAKVDGADKELARRILRSIMFSNRPLDLSELVDAIAIEDDSLCLKDLEKLKLHQPEDVFEICGSLIRYSESTRSLKLAHHSVREFLVTPVHANGVANDFFMLEDECCFQLAKTSLKYLNLADFGSRQFRVYEEGEEHSLDGSGASVEVIPDNPFLDYAATYWWSHVARINPGGEFLPQPEQTNPGVLDKLWPDIQQLFSRNRGNFLYWTSVLRYAHGEYRYPLSIKPLHICALHNLTDIAQRLISDGHSPYVVTQDQRTPLHIALQNGNIEMVQRLIKYRSLTLSSRYQLEKPTADGRHPLHLAIESGNGQAVKILVEAGASVTAPLPNGDFPLSIAVENGWHDLVPILLKGADLHPCLADGRSMLHLAAELGHEIIAKQLLDHEMDANRRDNNGWAPIHFSAHHGHREIIEMLLQHNADATLCDINGWTPLHAAIYRRHLGCASLLLQEGSSRSAVSPGTRLAHHPSAGSSSSNIWSSQLGQAFPTLPDTSYRRSSSTLNTPAPRNDGPLMVDGRYSLQPHVHRPSVASSSTSLLRSYGNTYGGDSRGPGSDPGLRVDGKYALDRQSRTSLPALASEGSTKTMPSPLFIAVSNAFSAGVELLLNSSPDLSDMHECLNTALSLPNLSILEQLLWKAGDADVNNLLCKIEIGQSPKAHLLCLKAVHLRTARTDTNPIFAAIAGKHHEVLKLALQENQEAVCLEEGFKKAVRSSSFEDATLLAEYDGAKGIDQVSKGMTLLHEVVKAKNDKAVDFLIKVGANMSIPDQHGSMPLHLAVELDHLAIVEVLVSHDSPTNSLYLMRDKMGRTAFHIAAERGFLPVLEMLVSHDGNITQAVDSKGRTALHVAAEKGVWTTLQLLLESGSQIEAKDCIGETALHKASKRGSQQLVTLLLRKGANIELEDGNESILLRIAIEHKQEYLIRLFLKEVFKVVFQYNYFMITGDGNILLSGNRAEAKEAYKIQKAVLHEAAWNGHIEGIRILLQHGADPKSKDIAFETTPLHCAIYNGEEEAIRMLLDQDVDIDAKDKNRETALHWAAWRGNKVAIRLLLDHGARYDLKDMAGKTPLHWAAWKGEEEIVRMLLEKGADTEAKDDEGETPLHWAASIGRQAAALLILEQEGDINVKDRVGKTALHRAAEGRHNPVVQLILERECDIDAQDKDGRTALHWAAWNGDEKILKILLKKGANIGARDTVGRSALYRAAERGHKQIVELLMEKGANVEAKDNYGETALHRAARDGKKAMVSLLLEAGSDIEAKTVGVWVSDETEVSGETPLHWAAWNGHLGVVLLLLKKGADSKAMDTSGKTPLDRARQAQYEAVVEVLHAQA